MEGAHKQVLKYFVIIYVATIIFVVLYFSPTLLYEVQKKDILPEVIGFLFEFTLIGIGLTVFQLMREKSGTKKRYIKTIEDYKYDKKHYSPVYLRNILEKLNEYGEHKFDFSGYDLSNIQLNGLILNESNFTNCNLMGCDFSDSNISDAFLINVKIDASTNLKYSKYDGVKVNANQIKDFKTLGVNTSYLSTI